MNNLSNNTTLVDGDTNTNENGLTSLSLARMYQRAEPIEIVFKDLTYKVKLPSPTNGSTKKSMKRFFRHDSAFHEVTILDKLNGVFRHGRFTAILGPSGSGKTSLLNVLGGAISRGSTNNIAGDILLNGKKISTGALRLVSSYVFQDDAIMATSTIFEALLMSVRLRVPKLSPEEQLRRVNDILTILDLHKAADTIVGSTTKKGISGGERKRTAIGMEIVTNPSAILLDEPSSGLDSYSSFNLVHFLKRFAADYQRTVVATLHQPSSEIFHEIDDLIILSEGKIVFNGEASSVVKYFTNIGYTIPEHYNPPDFIFMGILNDINMLKAKDVDYASIKIETRKRLEHIYESWEKSEMNREIKDAVKAPRLTQGIQLAMLKYQAKFWTQFKFLSRRVFRNAWRNKLFVRARLFQTLFLSVFISLVYLDVMSSGPPNSVFQNLEGALFFVVVNQFFSNVTNLLSVFGTEKPVFAREYVNGYYRLPAYFFSRLLVELPFLIFFPILFSCITYYIIGFRDGFGHFLLYTLILVLTSLCGAGMGVLGAALFNDINIALIIVPLLILPMMIFGGLFVANATAPPWLNWISWISPIQYAYTSLALDQIGGLDIGGVSGDNELARLTINERLSIGVNIVLLVVIYIFFIVAAYLALLHSVRKVGESYRKMRKQVKKEIALAQSESDKIGEGLPATDIEQGRDEGQNFELTSMSKEPRAVGVASSEGFAF